MADVDLKDRLRETADAFDGLLSLIPAKDYYGEETSGEWPPKKKSKAEKKAAKLGKLDPDSEKNRTAKEVMEEKARNKRKLEQMDDATGDDEVDDADDLPVDGIEMEQPLKRQKTVDGDDDEGASSSVNAKDTDAAPTPSAKEEKKLSKKQKKQEKQEKKAAKRAAGSADQTPAGEPPSTTAQPDVSKSTEGSEPKPSTEVDEDSHPKDDLRAIDLPGLTTEGDEDSLKSTSPSLQKDSPVFDAASPPDKDSLEPASTATSIASAVPPSEKPRHAKLPSSSTDVFRARLAARIEALRKARKADGEEGRPAQTRQELIESRRQKQAQRKEHKKELRRLAKEEEDRKREEALASARTSPGSFMSPLNGGGSLAGGSDDGNANHFAFGRIAFADGAQMSHDLSYVKEKGKKKGPSDPKTALAKLEAQKKRVEGLDEDKRKEVLEKETWLAARRRAEGEKIRDDETILKKAVKRKEHAKKKSEREWGERKAGVDKAMKDRQKKREDNLRKRRDEKALGKMGKKKKGGASKGPKKRAGFEGTGLGGGKRK